MHITIAERLALSEFSIGDLQSGDSKKKRARRPMWTPMLTVYQ
jgi:hypothetical protein